MRHPILPVPPHSIAALVALAGLLGACAAESSAGAPDAGGGGGGGSGGAPGCVDLSISSACRWEGEGNGCSANETCTLSSASTCGEASCCTLGTECRPIVFGASPAGFACAQDGDCQGGVCVELSTVGICLRPCDTTVSLGECPEGQFCAIVQLDAQRSVHTCVGGEEGRFDLERVFCGSDTDCVEGRYCLVAHGAGLPVGEAYGLCVPGERAGEAGRLCEGEATRELSSLGELATAWSDGCAETGLCHEVCSGQGARVCTCEPGSPEGFCRAARCTHPCSSERDCPSPLVCRGSAFSAPGLPHPHPELEFGYCQFPDFNGTDWGCWDQTDCCSGGFQRDGAPCCAQLIENCGVAPPTDTVCRVTIAGARYTSRCAIPTGLAAIGAGCAAHEACESGLCVDGACTSPCDTGRADRCGELVPGASCCGVRVADACVRACRLDCDGLDACTP